MTLPTRVALAMSVLLSLACLMLLPVTGARGASVDAALPTRVAGGGHGGNARPNIVLISTDDQTVRDLESMPRTRRLLGGHGVRFVNALSPHPLCCPARAEMLTGQFAQNNGVRTNAGPHGGVGALQRPNNVLPVWLKKAGYRTAFIGKYLNGYESFDAEDVPAGWDYWNASYRHVYDYDDVRLDQDGRVVRYPGVVQADVYARRTDRLLGELAGPRPFFLWQSQLAPHLQLQGNGWEAPTASKRNTGTFSGHPLDTLDVPSFNERKVGDKPASIRDRRRLHAAAIERLTTLNRGRLESLQDVDDAVARLVRRLKELGEYRRTLVIFTSDNGFMLGEHRYLGKVLPYEESVRVPLLIAGPKVPDGVVRRQSVTTVDLVPTILAAAGASPGRRLDGHSLLPAARSAKAGGWDTVLLQAGPAGAGDGGDSLIPSAALRPARGYGWFYRGVRTKRYTYARYTGSGEEELYDRRVDPWQLKSVADDPRYAAINRILSRRTEILGTCGGDCLRTWRPVPGPRRR